MEIDVAVEIVAPAERIWATLIDVERWPEFTESIASVKRLESGELELGSKVRIAQPRLPEAVWEVTKFEKGVGFVWQTKSVGVVTMGKHWMAPGPDGRTTVTLKIRQHGLLAPILGPFLSGLTRRYVELEAQGLKRRCESAAT